MAGTTSSIPWITVIVIVIKITSQKTVDRQYVTTTPSPPGPSLCRLCEWNEYCLSGGACCSVSNQSLNLMNDTIEPWYDCRSTKLITDENKTDYHTHSDEYFNEYSWMITKCSHRSSNITLKELCENDDTADNILSIWPVSDSVVHYKNEYCAYCNGVKKSKKLKNWSGEIYCDADLSSSKNLVSAVKKRRCNIFFRPPEDVSEHSCVDTHALEPLPHANDSNKEECPVVIRFVYDVDTLIKACDADSNPQELTFKPYLCYTDVSSCSSFGADICVLLSLNLVDSISPPFTALINLDAIVNKADVIKMDDCDEATQFTDKNMMICREMLCHVNRYLSNGECVLVVKEQSCYNWMLFIRFTPDSDFTTKILRKESFQISLQLFFEHYFPVSVVKEFKLYTKTTQNDERSIVVEYFVIRIVINIKPFVLDIISHIFKEMHNVDVTISTTVFHSETAYFEPPSISVSDTDPLKLDLPFGMPSVYLDQVRLPQIRFPEASVYNTCISLFNKLQVCPFLKIHFNDIPFYIEDNFLYIGNNKTYVFSYGEYSGEGDTLHLCVADYKIVHDAIIKERPTKTTNKTNTGVVSAKQVLAFFCVCLSLICLLFTLFVYFKLPELHSQPGVNNMTLCVSLFLAQTVYQFGAGQTSLPASACALIGGLCHFLWLTVMFSMNICSVEMYQVFKKLTKLPSKFSIKHTIRNILYIVASSGLLVLINIFISLYLSQGVDSVYGGKICYFSSKSMHLFTFVFPSLFLTIINITLFVFVVLKINKTYIRSLNLTQERNYLSIYTRLSTLTGLTWVFGYLNLLLREDILEYVFIFLNASQGVVIMIAFVANKRVLSLFCKKKERISQITSRSDLENKTNVSASAIFS